MSNIDFSEMRWRGGVPKGDLFTVMENWRREDDFEAAMQVIKEVGFYTL